MCRKLMSIVLKHTMPYGGTRHSGHDLPTPYGVISTEWVDKVLKIKTYYLKGMLYYQSVHLSVHVAVHIRPYLKYFFVSPPETQVD